VPHTEPEHLNSSGLHSPRAAAVVETASKFSPDRQLGNLTDSAMKGGVRPQLREALSAAAIALNEKLSDREAVVRRSGELLMASGRVDSGYTDAMLAALEEFGPYIVLAPGVALAHARPTTAVHGVAFSLLTLDPPVAFGHPENDPVRLVLGMAAPDDESHIEALSELAELLGDDTRRRRLMTATTAQEVLSLIGPAGRQEAKR
jgi:mannitol/fructose-specific phosphotransferase system IIA component (Ntr-type)